MADVRISNLPQAGTLTGDELFALVQDGVTKKATLPTLEILQGTKIREVFRPFSEAGEGVSELQNVCDIVNSFTGFIIPSNQVGVISFLQYAGGVFGTEFTKFSYILKTGAGNYGLGQTQITPANLIKLAPITTSPDPDFIYDLGNIGTTAVHTFVNGAGPYLVDGLTVFEAVQNGDDKIWLFVGGNGNYGDGATATVADDFVDLTAQDPIPSTPTFLLPVKKIQVTPYTITNDDLNRPLWFTSNNQVVNIPTTFLATNTNILLYDFEAYFSGTGTHTVNHPQSGIDTFSQGDYIKALRYDNAGDTLWTVQQWGDETGSYAVSNRLFQGVLPDNGLVSIINQPGALKIKLPIRSNYTSSIRLQLEIRKNGNPYTLEVIDITARPMGATGWANTSGNVNRITSSDGVNYSVRYGNDGTSPCIWIGELADSFSDSAAYFCLRYVAYAETTNTGLPMNFFRKGWALSRATSFGTVVATQSTSEWRSARTFVSALPSGQSAGRIRTNSADGNRPYHDNGTEWKGLAYVDETNLQGVTNNGNETTNDVVLKADDGIGIYIDRVEDDERIIEVYRDGGAGYVSIKSGVGVAKVDISGLNGSIGLTDPDGDFLSINPIKEITTTAITLNNILGNYNATPAYNATYTTSSPVAGGNATLLIDTTGEAAFPSVTGATLNDSSPFAAAKIYRMEVYTLDGVNVEYSFILLRDA